MAGQVCRAGALWLALGVAVGCSRTPPSTGESAPVETSAQAPESAAASGSRQVRPAVTSDPAQAVRQVLQGLEKRRLRAVWDFLPASYQGDLQKIARQVGERMDPDLWKRAWSLPPRLARLMRERGEWMLQPASNAPSTSTAPRPLATTDLRQLADCLDLLAGSELSDTNRLKSIDLGAWCDRVGESLLGQVELFARRMPGDSLAQTLAVLGDVRVDSAERAGDQATVQLSTPGSDPVPVEYVRVEGKWIPRDLADGWTEGVGLTQARVAVFLSPDALEVNRPEWEAVLSATEEWLQRLEQAEAKEEFDFAWAQGVQNVLTIVAGLSPAQISPESDPEAPAGEEATGDPTEANPVPLVKVVIRGQFGALEQDRWLEQAAARVDGGQAQVRELAATTAELSLTVGPVADCEEFARKLSGWTISKVDRATRTIWASPAPTR